SRPLRVRPQRENAGCKHQDGGERAPARPHAIGHSRPPRYTLQQGRSGDRNNCQAEGRDSDDHVAVSVSRKALWYIDSHLGGDLALESIAGVVGVSRFHLSRAFGLSTGSALASYVRGRRLSEAARRLADGAPDILAVALDTGYGSHEAFTRAFRQ